MVGWMKVEFLKHNFPNNPDAVAREKVALKERDELWATIQDVDLQLQDPLLPGEDRARLQSERVGHLRTMRGVVGRLQQAAKEQEVPTSIDVVAIGWQEIKERGDGKKDSYVASLRAANGDVIEAHNEAGEGTTVCLSPLHYRVVGELLTAQPF